MGSVVLAVVLVLALLTAAPAPARTLTVDPSVRDSPLEIGSAHFVVHYVTADGDRNRTTAEAARGMSDFAEQAYARFTAEWKFPGPLPDPPAHDDDPRTDIYIGFSTIAETYAGSATPDKRSGGPTSAWLQIRPDRIGPFIAGHELFHIFQMALSYPNDSLVSEGSAQWAGNTMAGIATRPGFADPSLAVAAQTLEATRANGLDGKDHWAFWEHIIARHGPGIIKDVLDRSEALRTGGLGVSARQLPALDQALNARGSSLAHAFVDYSADAAARDWSSVPLRAFSPTPTATLSGSGDLGNQSLSIEHLAMRFIAYDGDGELRVRVSWAAGLAGVRPMLVVDGVRHPLSVSGSAATGEASIAGSALVAVASPSLRAGAQTFTVSSELVTEGYPAPRIRVTKKPRVVRVRGRRVLRFTVAAKSRGRVAAELKRGSTKVARGAHFFPRAGSYRFTLKLSRRTKAGKYRLWLYPRGSTSDDLGAPTVVRVTLPAAG